MRDAEPGNVETVAIPPSTGEERTVLDVSGDLEATTMLDSATESTSTQVLADEDELETPTELTSTVALAEEDELTPTVALAEEAEPVTPTKPMSAPGSSGAYRRVGTGIPSAEAGASASQISPGIAAAWRGGPAEKPRRALLRGWLLPLVVLVGVIVLLLWQHLGGRVSVSGVAAAARTSVIGCDSTETVTATLRTNGEPGTIDYRWVRSDGTASDELHQSVSKGTKQVDVVLRWAFSGHGSMHALATIDVQSPGMASAVASFDYVCH